MYYDYDYDDYCNDFYDNTDIENNNIAVAIFLSHHETQPVDTNNVEEENKKTPSKTPPNDIHAHGATMLKARYVQATILLTKPIEQQQEPKETNIVDESKDPTSATFRPTKPNHKTTQETTTNEQQANQLRSERLKDRNRKHQPNQIMNQLRNHLRREILKDRNRHYKPTDIEVALQQPIYTDSKQQQKKKPPSRKQQRMMQLMHHGHLASAINQRRSERLKDRNRGYSKYNNALSNQRRSQILKDRNRGHISNDVINNKQ